MTKQLVKFGMAVMTMLLALIVLWQFRTVVVYVLISLTIAAVLRPLFYRLAGRGIVVRIAWILVYLAALGCFGFIVYVTGRIAANEIKQLAQTISVQDTWRLPLWLEGSSFQQTIETRLPPPSKLFEAVTGDQGQLVLPALIGVTQGIGSVVSALIIILFLSIYWSSNQIHFERLWLSLLPSNQRKQARGIWRTVEPDIGTYIRAEVIQSFMAGILLGLGYWLIGSPYPAILALIGALAFLVPVVGIPLVIIPVALVGLLTSVQVSVFTALYALIVLMALIIWVKPRLFNRRWENPILTLVLLIALASAFGLVGIIIAPPLSVVFQILWSRLVSRRVVIGASAQISDLKERQTMLFATIQAMSEPPPPLVTSSLERLAGLIEKAEPILQVDQPVGPSGLALQPPKPNQEGVNARTPNS